ncbi:MAG: hypothetical protein K0R02_724 [Rickettsiaceae bacterium]|jgi:hypothetical protein|nr:hypothetical protein [Rickettsiaceae bacterium]
MNNTEIWNSFRNLANNYDQETDPNVKEKYNVLLKNLFQKKEVKDYFKNDIEIHYVLLDYKTETAITILKALGDINYQSSHGNTAAHIAIQNNEVELLKELELNGADLNIQNDKGQTCLHSFSSNITSEILDFISNNNNLDHTIFDNNRELPIHIAIKNHQEQLKEYRPDHWNKNYLEECIRRSEKLISTLEQKYNNMFEYPPQLSLNEKKNWSIPELIRSISCTFNNKQRSEFKKVIDTAWEVANEAAIKGDISLKVNLAYYALKIANDKLNSTENKIITAIGSDKVHTIDIDKDGNSIYSFVRGWRSPKTIGLAYDLKDLPNTINNLMHEILHDTIDEVYKNNAEPNYGISDKSKIGDNNISTNIREQRQLDDFTKDIKSLYKFSEEKDEGKISTRNIFSSVFNDLYVTKNVKGNRTENLDNPVSKEDKTEIEFNPRTVRQEMYTYLMSLKAHEYTKNFLEKGKITQDSNAVAHAPHINAAFQQEFTRNILPDFERKLEDLKKQNKIKITGIDTLEAEIKNHYELSKQGKPKRIYEPESKSKSWTHHVGKDAPKTNNKPVTPATPASSKVSALKNKFEELAKKESHVERIKGKSQSEDKNRNK